MGRFPWLTSGFARYVEEQNPDYEIEWIVGDDSLDFYDYQAKHGSLPDVILAKDFNRVSAESLSASLYDLGGTDIAASYDEDTLKSVPGNSDAVKYLPGASGFEGIVINSYLFDLYGHCRPKRQTVVCRGVQVFLGEGN